MKWVIDNWPAKLLSFAIALVIWIFVRVEERNELVLRIPVRYANLPGEMVIVSDQVPEIKMVVEGPGTLLTQLEQGAGAYSINLEGTKTGLQRIRIETDNIRFPRGVNVVRIIPSEIEIRLANTSKYRLPLQAILSEDGIAEGFEISNVEIEPSQLEIVVAEGQLDGFQTIKTVQLPFSDRKSDWSGVVQVQTDNLNVKSITTREVEVFVQVVPKIVERTVKNIPIRIRGLQDRYIPAQSTAKIKMAGPENLVGRMTEDSVSAYIQIGNPIEAGSRLPVFADLPDQVFLVEIDPVEVVVRLK